MKREPIVWENIFANDTSERVWSPKYVRNSHDSTLGRQTTQLKMDKGPEQTLLRRGHTGGPETYERMLSITSQQRDAIKTTTRYHFTLVRMAIITKSTNKCWKGCGEKGTLVHCWWECRLVQPPWQTVWNFFKKTKNRSTFWHSNPTAGIIP